MIQCPQRDSRLLLLNFSINTLALEARSSINVRARYARSGKSRRRPYILSEKKRSLLRSLRRYATFHFSMRTNTRARTRARSRTDIFTQLVAKRQSAYLSAFIFRRPLKSPKCNDGGVYWLLARIYIPHDLCVQGVLLIPVYCERVGRDEYRVKGARGAVLAQPMPDFRGKRGNVPR